MRVPRRRPEAGPRVLLVRHGESTWNADGRWQGHADPPLSDMGVAQARAASSDVARVDAVWCSDLVRARQTAELCAPTGVPVNKDPRLRERDVGAWTGLTRDAIEDQCPGWLAAGRHPDGWEEDAAVAARGWDALHRVLAALPPGAGAVVISHGGLIRAIESQLGVAPRPIPNLGGRWLHGGSAGLVLGDRVTLVGRDGDHTGSEPAVAAPE
jgi:probable phosphoglycerate mutase